MVFHKLWKVDGKNNGKYDGKNDGKNDGNNDGRNNGKNVGKKDGKNEVDPRLTVHNVQQLEPGRKSQLGRSNLCRGE